MTRGDPSGRRRATFWAVIAAAGLATHWRLLMQVQVHTDNHIKGSEELSDRVGNEVTGSIERFRDQITRVDVHLHDLNGPKGGEHHIRCVIEARPAGLQPVAVSHDSATLEEAVTGAAERLEHSLTHLLDKLAHRKGRTSFAGDQEI